MTLAQLLDRAVLRQPDAEALVDGGTRFTYAELAGRTATLARGFAALGVGRGDRALIALRNRAEHVVAFWALQKIGAVAVPVNFRLVSAELGYVLQDSAPRVVLFEEGSAAAVTEAARGRDLSLVYVGDIPPAGAVLFESVLDGVDEPGRLGLISP